MATPLIFPPCRSSLTPEGNLSRYLQEIRKFPLLEPQQEFHARQGLAGTWGFQSRPIQLVTSHLRLVAKIAWVIAGYGLPVAELISRHVGMMPGREAVFFDPDRGFRLATYAMWWIRGSSGIHPSFLVAGEDGHHGGAEEAVLQPAQLQGQMQATRRATCSPSR